MFPTSLAANTFPSPSTVPTGNGFQFGLLNSSAVPAFVLARIRALCAEYDVEL